MTAANWLTQNPADHMMSLYMHRSRNDTTYIDPPFAGVYERALFADKRYQQHRRSETLLIIGNVFESRQVFGGEVEGQRMIAAVLSWRHSLLYRVDGDIQLILECR